MNVRREQSRHGGPEIGLHEEAELRQFPTFSRGDPDVQDGLGKRGREDGEARTRSRGALRSVRSAAVRVGASPPLPPGTRLAATSPRLADLLRPPEPGGRA